MFTSITLDVPRMSALARGPNMLGTGSNLQTRPFWYSAELERLLHAFVSRQDDIPRLPAPSPRRDAGADSRSTQENAAKQKPCNGGYRSFPGTVLRFRSDIGRTVRACYQSSQFWLVFACIAMDCQSRSLVPTHRCWSMGLTLDVPTLNFSVAETTRPTLASLVVHVVLAFFLSNSCSRVSRCTP